ncbi:IS3 family transposase [Streptomyces sp. NBC_01591]|uniref:IS3 family transposase n=1 Tax=Streptomyces sp. NBC_01591 TaxID=2975888 RepID=UPI002DDBDC42|nr:IS3 family transposase [Streptomyces sp. NBC_01591]WSD66220.1 IS3 family transposase [Streptomyces sp. NBC_01591]
MSEICRFIHAEKANYPVTLLCKVTKTARSTYYAWVAGREARAARRRADEALAHEITVIHLASRRNYGVPRVTAELRRRGRPVNRKRVERVMREHGIAGNSRRTGRRSLTRADTKAAPSPDLIGRDFTATRPGTKIVGDITYIPTAEGWLYLAAWLDLATREVIGYSMANHHRTELVVDALDMAAALGRLEPGCVIHSDRGSEYTSRQLRDRIGLLEHRQSMGRTGSCFDNAAAESFWAVLKEEIGTHFWPDRATARAGRAAAHRSGSRHQARTGGRARPHAARGPLLGRPGSGFGRRRWRSSSPTPAFARCRASACARSTPATGTRRTARTRSAPRTGSGGRRHKSPTLNSRPGAASSPARQSPPR